ncbi:MAG: CHASE3 domain-containing protein [Myxococcaceae bacterium]
MRGWPLTVALLALAGLLGGAIYAIGGLANSIGWVHHTSEVRLALGRLQQAIVDAEAGLRGYLVGGDRGFLDPYESAMGGWHQQLDELKKLTADNPEQQRNLEQLATLVERRVRVLEETRRAYESGAPREELNLEMTRGKQITDQARELMVAMDEIEDRLDDQRHAQAISRWKWTLVLFMGGALAFVLVVAASWLQRNQADARRLLAEDSARSAELFKVVLQGSEVGITVQDPAGKLVYANGAAARMTGAASPEALLSEPPLAMTERFEVFGADGAALSFGELPGRAVLAGQSAEPMQVRFVDRRTRAERWSLVRSVPARDASGKLLYAINFFRDTTAEMRDAQQRGFLLQASIELQRTLDYQKTLTTLASLAVPALGDWCTIDVIENGRPTRVAAVHRDPSKLAEAIEYRKRYPVNARSPVNQVVESGQPLFVPKVTREALLGQVVDDHQMQIIEKLNLEAYVTVPMRARGSTIGAISVAIAGSGRQLTERDVEVAQSFADRAAAAIDAARLLSDLARARDVEEQRRRTAEAESEFAQTFIGILGHDLRNPINAVAMSAELLRRREELADSTVLNRILASTKRMAIMVSQLLDLTRSRLGSGIELEKRPADLVAIVNAAVEELRAVHPGRVLRWEPPAPAECVVDAARLAQVFSNLIANALEHSPPSSEVTVKLQATDGWATCSVHNEGAIPADLLGSIFEPYRARRHHGARRKGLGLGVFISQQISIAHGGALEVSSTPESGTTFEVHLPRGRNMAEPVEQPLS